MSAEEAGKDLHLYKLWTGIGVAFLVAFGLKLATAEHRHLPEKKPYTHLEIRHKPWPWGDGNTSMFAQIFGKPEGAHHDESHAKPSH